VPFVLLYSIAYFIGWVTHRSPARPYFASCVGIAGPFFASVAILFGLFAAFLGNDVERRGASAVAAIFREADGIGRVLRLSEAVGKDADQIKAEALAYLRFVLDEELPKMRERGAAPNKLGKERTLGLAVMDAALPPAVQTAMVGALITVREARLERRLLSGDTSSSLSWFAVIALGVLTQIAVAVVQLDKPRPQALALFVFTTAFAVTVALIAVGERPFSGRTIDDEPLREVVASVS
jgi:hypothetical protein